MDFPGGSTTLTPDQAIILTRYLDDNYLNNEEKLRSVLTTIANLATFAESEFVFFLEHFDEGCHAIRSNEFN